MLITQHKCSYLQLMTLIRQHLTSMKPSTGFLIQDTSDRRNEGRGGEWKVFKKEREKTPLGGLITESYRRLTFSREEVQQRAEGRTIGPFVTCA